MKAAGEKRAQASAYWGGLAHVGQQIVDAKTTEKLEQGEEREQEKTLPKLRQ